MKKIAPSALVALKEALSVIYWYKNDLQTFVHQTVDDHRILARLNWSEPKRNVVGSCIDLLSRDEGTFQPILLKLMSEVARLDDFGHLERLEDGKAKADAARQAVARLRNLIKPTEDDARDLQKAKERQRATENVVQRVQGVAAKLAELKAEFFNLVTSCLPQKRGFQLEKILRELFAVFDLDPKASFRIVGEQIDGAFTFDNTDYLLSAKWQQEPVGIEDLDAFAGKVNRNFKINLGLFVSINGYSPTGIEAHCKGTPAIILMDGQDLIAVLEGRIRLDDLLLRKRRHASQTGSIFLKVADIMQGK